MKRMQRWLEGRDECNKQIGQGRSLRGVSFVSLEIYVVGFCVGTTIVRELVSKHTLLWNIGYWVKMTCWKIRCLYFLNVYSLNFKCLVY